MITLTLLLIVAAGVTVIGHFAKGWPLGIPVAILVVIHALAAFPR